MAIDGSYGFVYCGNNGLGIGVFTVKGNRVESRDYFGVRYTGTAVQDAEERIELDLTLDVPAGVTLAPGTAPQDLPHTRQVRQTMPPAFGDGNPVEITHPVR
jgi:hypothetical protein